MSSPVSLLAAAEAGRVDALVECAASEAPADAIAALDDSQLQRLWVAATPLVEAALEAAEPAMQT